MQSVNISACEKMFRFSKFTKPTKTIWFESDFLSRSTYKNTCMEQHAVAIAFLKALRVECPSSACAYADTSRVKVVQQTVPLTTSMAGFFVGNTLPETNMAHEIWWLEDVFPIGNAYFQGLCCFRECKEGSCFACFRFCVSVVFFVVFRSSGQSAKLF